MIFENEKNKKNNLLNSVHVEIEKENGEKQLKIVEISKEDGKWHDDYSTEEKSKRSKSFALSGRFLSHRYITQGVALSFKLTGLSDRRLSDNHVK